MAASSTGMIAENISVAITLCHPWIPWSEVCRHQNTRRKVEKLFSTPWSSESVPSIQLFHNIFESIASQLVRMLSTACNFHDETFQFFSPVFTCFLFNLFGSKALISLQAFEREIPSISIGADSRAYEFMKIFYHYHSHDLPHYRQHV